jgi:integrase
MSNDNGRESGKWGRVWRYEGTRGVVWRIRYRDATGRRVLETLGREPEWSRTRAERELRRRLVDVERDGYRKPEKVTFAVFAERWLEEYLPSRNLKPTTVRNYTISVRRHLVPFFGSYELSELEQQPELLDRYIATKLKAGLSPKSIGNTLTDLRLVLKQAVRQRLIRTNPVDDVERPRCEPPEMQVLSEAEIARLWSAYRELEHEASAAERPWWQLARAITFVGLGTAMRRGELLALRWSDVRMLDGVVQVREAFVDGCFTTPKSRSSRRLIELGPRTRELFGRRWQETAFRAESDLVFCHPTKGTPLDPSKLARVHLRPALRRAGITKPFRPFHDLRHTALTHEAAAGNPMAYVQLKAGHSQSAITERYIHAAQVLFPGAAALGEARIFSGALFDQVKAPRDQGD